MDKKKMYLSLVLAVFALILPKIVEPMGLGNINMPSRYVMAANPYSAESFDFIADGYEVDMEPYAEGDLKDYVSFSTPEEIGPYRKKFTATISIPGEVNATPGPHSMHIGAVEKIDSTGGINVKTRVYYPMDIFVLYPYKYIEASFKTQNVNENETAQFYVTVRNFGKVDINVLKARIDVFNLSHYKIGELNAKDASLESGKSITIPFDFDTNGLMGGKYYANATIDYDGDIKTLSRDFNIGRMLIRVLNYTKNIYSDNINKFEIVIKNDWGGIINGIFAEISIYTPQKNISAKTSSESMNELSEASLKTYVDANGTMPGVYPIKIDVLYGESKTVERGEIEILKSKAVYLTGSMLQIGIFAVGIILIILTLINAILLFRRKRADSAEKDSNGPN